MTLAAIVATLGSPQAGKPSTPLAALGSGVSVLPSITIVNATIVNPSAAVGAGFGVTPSVQGTTDVLIAAQAAVGSGAGVTPSMSMNPIVISSTGIGAGVNPTVSLPTGTIVHVQDSPSNTSTSMPVTLTLPSLPTASNWLTVVVGGASSSAVPVFAVSGGGVGTWNRAREASALSAAEVWYGEVTGTPSQSITVGLTSGNVSLGQQCTATEWSGIVQLDPNPAVGNTGTSTTAAPGSFSPSAHGELFLSSFGNANSFIGTQSGYTALGATAHSGIGMWGIGSGTVNPTVTINTSNTWAAVVVGFSPISLPAAPNAATLVSAVPGNAQVRVLTWTPSNVGALPTGYQVGWNAVSGGGTGGSTGTSATSITITGLVNGATYNFFVYAGNSILGPISNILSATPTGGTPNVLLWANTTVQSMTQAMWNTLADWGFSSVSVQTKWPFGFGGTNGAFNGSGGGTLQAALTTQAGFAHNAGMKIYLGIYLEDGSPPVAPGTPCVEWFSGNWSGWNTMISNYGAAVTQMGFDGMVWDTEGDGSITWQSAYSGNSNTQAATFTQVTARAKAMMQALQAAAPSCPVYIYMSEVAGQAQFPGCYWQNYLNFNGLTTKSTQVTNSVYKSFVAGLAQGSSAAIVNLDPVFYSIPNITGSAPFAAGNTAAQAWSQSLAYNASGFSNLSLPSNVSLVPFTWPADQTGNNGSSGNTWSQADWNAAQPQILASLTTPVFAVYEHSNTVTSGALTIDYSANTFGSLSPTPNYTPLDALPPTNFLYVSSQTQSGVESLASTLGLPSTTGLSGFTPGSTWPSISSFVPTTSGIPLLMAVSMCPTGVGVSAVPSNLSTFSTLARELPNGTICRIGWEFDIDTGAWGPGINGNTPAGYVTAFQDIVTTMRGVNNTLKFDFCCQAGQSSLATLETYYPGDAYVDYIGGDHYDQVGGGANFSAMGAAVNLAALRGKPVSCGEWGLNGTDDPTFINNAAQFFFDPAEAAVRYGWPSYSVGYQSYFSFNGSINSDITQFPNSIAAYKLAFG